ncbi:MAG TPA: hypothetical protein VN815_16075, partial [Steroidobacteraceae bacterium]|nr:hypothetical protein [Steroidobacteraceae bacterium]
MNPKSTEFRSKGKFAAALTMSGVLVMVTLPAIPQPQQPRPQEGATITPNYKDADLSQIIQAVGEVTGKNF